MINIKDFILQFFKFAEVRAESQVKENLPEETKRPSQIWPRLMFLSSNHQTCDDDENETEEQPPSEVCTEPEKDPCEEETEETEDICECPRTGGFSKKLGCMYHGARFGLREGALSGVFFGGGLGIYKYIDAVYLKGGNKEGDDRGGNSGDENESTINDNIIFVTAANGAIAMAVFCTLFCCTKAAIYCN